MTFSEMKEIEDELKINILKSYVDLIKERYAKKKFLKECKIKGWPLSKGAEGAVWVALLIARW